jgi:hypothetical protein
MNAADKAIEEIREVRHRISAEFEHDITKHLAHLCEQESQHLAQLQRGKHILAQRAAARQQYAAPAGVPLAIHDEPKAAKRHG